MKKLFHPKWLLIVSAFPLLLYVILALVSYNLKHGFEIKESVSEYFIILILLSLYIIGISIYAIISWKQHKTTHPIALQTSFLLPTLVYFAITYLGYQDLFKQIIFLDINLTSALLQAGLFAIGAVYGILLTVVHSSDPKKKNGWISVLYAILTPVIFYILNLLMGSKSFDKLFDIPSLLLDFILVGGAIFTTYHIIKAIYLFYKANNKKVYYKEANYIIVFALLLPQLGLLISFGDDLNLFGNFSNIWFFILAAVNGLALLIKDKDFVFYRISLFSLRCITFAYTVYFFCIFLPFTPLSILLILAIGIGVFMLTPIFLFFIHYNILRSDFNFLRNYISPIYLVVIAIISFSVIPGIVIYNLHRNYNEIVAASNFIEKPDYALQPKFDANKVIKTSETHKRFGGGLRSNKKTVPLITWYYKNEVMDGKFLSVSRGAALKSILTHKKPPTLINESPSDSARDPIELVQQRVVTNYDTLKQYWTSIVELQLLDTSSKMLNQQAEANEYFTSFNLPSGCYVIDYHLLINDTMEQGILAEQKAATWTYDAIVNTNRDPGFLKYITGERLSLKVFPFQPGELRTTTITFIHKEPEQLIIDGKLILLGDTTYTNAEQFTFNFGQSDYISKAQKMVLDTIKRKPYFYFIVDGSEGANAGNFASVINNFVNEHPEGENGASVSFVNYIDHTFTYNESLKLNIEKYKEEFGFNLDWAIRRAIYTHYLSNNNTYPVFIVCSNQFNLAYIENDFSDMRYMYPDADYFYNLSKSGAITKHNLFHFPQKGESYQMAQIETKSVCVWPNKETPTHYLSAEPGSDIIFNINNFDYNKFSLSDNAWENGLFFQTANRYHQIYPLKSAENWEQAVYQSFNSEIMTPVTAFLALENDAQKKLLKDKQAEILKGTQPENLGEEPQMMSEPHLLWFIVPSILFILWRRKQLLA